METPTPARGPLPETLLAPPLANEALAARVRALLPADWREGARVMRVHDGFAVGFRDAAGGQHVLRAQWQEANAPALVQGRRFDFSYLKSDAAPETAAVVARYREAAEALIAHEDQIAGALLPVGVCDPGNGFDLLAQPPASETLAARVRALIAADAQVVLTHDGFAVGFRDDAGAAYVLRAQEQDAEAPVLVRGRRFDFSYRKGEQRSANAITVARYRELSEALCAHEDQFAQDLLVLTAESGEARFGFLTPPPASESLAALVRAQLPPDWREDVQAVLAPGGFAVGFRDASGLQHELQAQWVEEEFSALVQGHRFDISYLKNDQTPPDAPMATLRALAEALLSHEDQFARDLKSAAAVGAADRGLELLAQPPANEALAAVVRALLPVDWRRHAKVVLAPGGFAVGFRDAVGVQHGLRARGLGEGFHALGRGRRFSLSYLQDPAAPPDPAMVARYQATAQALLAREDLLARDLEPTPAAPTDEQETLVPHERFDLLAQPSASEALTVQVRALLPDGAHASARVTRVHDGFAVGFDDAAGDPHVLRARWLDEEAPVLVHGQRFDFSYLKRDLSPENPITVARYREVIEALLPHEEQLAHALLPVTEGGASGPSAPASLLAPPPASEALTALVRAQLPPDWREDVQVVLAPGGFAAGFRDLSGVRHGLRAQWLEEGFPVLVEGQHLRVSYWKDDERAEQPEAMALDRTVAERLIVHEEALTHVLRATDTGATPRGFELFGPPPASEALTAHVRALLPDDGRGHLRVVRLHDGFAIGFGDGPQDQHVLRAQWLEADASALPRELGKEFHALGRGRRFSLSYLQDPAAPPDPAMVARYQATAQALLAREDLLARDLEPTPAAPSDEQETLVPHERFDLLAQPSASEALTVQVCALLPDGAHASARVTRVHDGFAVGFDDAAGDPHVLRARWLDEEAPVLVHGQRFDFSYLKRDLSPENPITVARYREVIEALLPHEEQLAHALLPVTEGGASGPSAPASLLAPPPASEALTALVRAQLPPDWREDVHVVLATGGFAAGFRDLSGVRHGLRAQWLEEGFPVLVEGQHLRVSYWKDDERAEQPEAMALDRTVAERLIVHEEALARVLRATDTGAMPRGFELFGPPPGIDLRAQPPAGEALAAHVRSLLPADWRAHARVVLVPDGFAVGFWDAANAQHVMRFQRLEEDFTSLVQGRHFAFSYLRGHARLGDDILARYHAVAAGLLGQESRIAQDLVATTQAPGIEFFTPPPTNEALATRVRALLPTDWCEGARLALTRDGFAVGFRDGAGVLHVLRAQRQEEGFARLAQGRRFAVSYLKTGPMSDGAAAGAPERIFAEILLAQEDQLALHIHPESARETGEEGDDEAQRGLGFSAPQPTSESLVARVRALLPVEWRQDVRVVLVPGGFAVGFRDAAGVQHGLRARGAKEGPPALVQGRRFRFSYLKNDNGPDDPSMVVRYREVLSGFLVQEDQIADELHHKASP